VYKTTGYIVLLGFSLLLIRCGQTDDPGDQPVAQVGTKILKHSELVQIIPDELPSEDSTKLADEYIRKWIRQELLIQKANENLTPEQKDLSKEIDEYRNSLIIYKYKNALLGEQMDTTVTSEQIETYYNNNTENFRLNTNIVKGIFMKIPANVVNSRNLKKMLDDTSDEGIAALREYCVQYAKNYDFFTDNWVSFRRVRNNLPYEIDNPEELLRQKSVIEQKDSEFYYVVSIFDYRLQNEIAPIEYVKENIKTLILNKRKVELLQQIEENVYKEGVRQNKFKIFKSEDGI
jgi:hypothetical protein